MDNQFNSNGGEQNIAQGDGAIGQQNNATQDVRGDGCISSGTGNVTVYQGLSLKPKTVVIASVLAAAVLGASLVGYHLLAPPPSAAVNSNTSGVPPEVFAKYVKELGATEQTVNGFFSTLLERNVPRDLWDKTLREIAATHKELLARLDSVQSEDAQVAKLKQEAKQAIDAHAYAKAEELLLKQAEARDVQAIAQMEKTAKQRRRSAAETNTDQASLQEVQLHYEKAAAYWQKAAALLPDKDKTDRGDYLIEAGYDLKRIGKYKEALPLFEQSLSINQEIGDKEGGATTLNNIALIHRVLGDYDKALTLYEQNLILLREIGNKAGEAVTSWNIGLTYAERGDLAKAEPYMSRAAQRAEERGYVNLEEWRKALEDIRAKLRQGR